MTSITKFNPSRLAKLFFVLFLISIFFPIRYVFPTVFSYATGLYSDFTSISLYSSDIFLFLAFIFTLWSIKFSLFKSIFTKHYSIIAFLLWLILATFIFIWPISGLNIWFFAKFVELAVVSYGTIVAISNLKFQISKNWLLLIFLCLGTLQSSIGLIQFINQSSIGLSWLGEQVINPNLWGVAKVVSSGTTYIRAYGTFPHPNPLSAFLVATILINIYLLISTTWKKPVKIWLNLALFINIFGLVATFSRGAYFALGVGLLSYFVMVVITRRSALYDDKAISYWKRIASDALAMTLIKALLAFALAFLIFKPFLLTRATINDQATLERGIYNQTAINIVKDKPFTGIGIGESVLHMEQYTPVPLNPWQIQPIHNFFLLAAAELGIPGMLILIWIFISHLKKLVSSIKYQVLSGSQNLTTYYMLLTSLLLCFFVLMMFDHYFYTLQQTQMLLWVVLGLIAAETKKSPQK